MFKIILFLIYLSYVSGIDHNVMVKTSSGTVLGKTIKVKGQSVNQFLNIPFAEPPVGSLRFLKPKPIETPIKVRFKLIIEFSNKRLC